MNIEELRVAYKQILDDCFESSWNFASFIGFDHDYYARKRTFPNYIHYSFGATKAVIWEDTLPYVIKIPLELDSERDYCKLEVRNYKLAQEIPEIADCFAWCDFLFYYYDTPIYIMEKADCDEDEIYSRAFDAALSESCESNNVEKDSEDYDDYCESFSNEWDWMDGTEQVGYLYYNIWGTNIAMLFEDFCNENGINDLHSANWGYVDGRLVVVDYSGF